MHIRPCSVLAAALLFFSSLAVVVWAQNHGSQIGREVSIPRHLQDGEEFELSIPKLIAFGEKLFRANWTIQEGAGRPLSKGTGAPVADPSDPLIFPRNFNRISGPDANSCAGCHNEPFVGGGGDRVTEVFVLGQRFDFASFNHSDSIAAKGALDEQGNFATLQNIANERKTISMNGSGFIHHHGIQAEERFGLDVDADGDGFVNELTRADVTAVTVFQAALPVPGRVIPDDDEIEKAVRIGDRTFRQVGCAACHIPRLPLTNQGWIFTEPNPYNPSGNLRPGDAPTLRVDLTSHELPSPRLKPDAHGVVWVPAFTDLKLHDITGGPNDPNAEPLDQNQPATSSKFFAGNTRLLTRKLWGVANSGPFMHHGKFTTMREAVLAHAGEAFSSRQDFEALTRYEKDCVIEFLKTLQVLPPGTRRLVVNQDFEKKERSHDPD